MLDNKTWGPLTVARGTGGRLAFMALTLAVCIGAAPPGSARAADVTQILNYCSSCHGPGGHSPSPMFPHLAGQQKEYIIKQLQDFRNDTRTAPHAQTYLDYLVMWGLVTQLDPPTTDAIAAFYASQPPAAGLPAALPDVAAGRRIYTEGIPSENVPACVGCHGPSAQGTDSIPRLAGQYQAYLARQLEAFAAWSRQNATMHANSVNLTPEQISEVTAYLGTL
jgi:cytochrome c553